MIPTVTITVEFDEALIPTIAWQATLVDEDGRTLAITQGASAHDVLLAAGPLVDRHVADVLRRQAVPA